MIDATRLLKDLQRLLRDLENDLRERLDEVPEARARLEAQHLEARTAGRTGLTFEAWRDEFLTQAAVAWILGCVFVRFMEDNDLVKTPHLSGAGERRKRALDQHEMYFRDPERRAQSDRDYLLDVFERMRALPTAAELFDPKHNPLWAAELSGDGATRLLQFWQRVDPDSGVLVHDFTDPQWNTRFLGDLYQNLSESARKRYALLQTPEFVEEFILDRTLNPAIQEFGLREVRLIDPTCGSGHFLLGAFHRLFDRWIAQDPGANPRALAQHALDQVYGVDLNPFAIAIARFRLLVAALKVSDVRSMRAEEAPAFHVNVAAGDSLLHGRRFDQLDLGSGADQLGSQPGIGHAFMAEDLDELNRILGQQYHAVVGNPPYITVKDKALNQLYRDRYQTCHRQYSLAVPFTERFFGLALPGATNRSVGFVGMITANSFMKREFGKKLIEEFFPKVDLTHVIDTSGAYVPGHGTPTVILFGQERRPSAESVRTVMGIKGEPSTPKDPSDGKVWSAIVTQVDHVDSESEWVSVADTSRRTFGRHPWSIGGGGATELKEAVDAHAEYSLSEFVTAVGRTTVVGEDDAWMLDCATANRHGLVRHTIPFVIGECVRDWVLDGLPIVIYPYEDLGGTVIDAEESAVGMHLWRFRALLAKRTVFGKTLPDRGEPWYVHLEHYTDKLRTPLSITFAFVATHNHFVLDRGGKVFNRSAPVIKLPADATEDDHLSLVGLFNSSTACFWMKQVFHNKGGGGIGGGIASEEWEQFYEFTGTGLKKFPVPESKPLDLSTDLDRLAQDYQSHLPAQWANSLPLTRNEIDAHQAETDRLLGQMRALQEELDWRCYALYGLMEAPLCYALANDSTPLPDIKLGERAFEIVMARQVINGELQTTWFDRHGSTPITDIPAHWPNDYRALVERRIAIIQNDRNIALIEKPEYKRRWNQEQWKSQEDRALRRWLLDRLEAERFWSREALQTTARLAEQLALDEDFMRVAELYRGHADFDVPALIAELVANESVPFLPTLRYKPTGLRKREVWERTWALQRTEDAIDAEVEASISRLGDESDEAYRARVEKAAKVRKASEVGDIPVPPKYRPTDFLNTTYWSLRGALDVPKERFVSYPHCSPSADASLLVAWAGWNPLQQAHALAAHYLEMKEQEGWPPERLVPLLAGLRELLPWVKQWHNEVDSTHGVRMGDYFEDFANEEARELGVTPDDIAAWTPPATVRTRGARKKKTADSAAEA